MSAKSVATPTPLLSRPVLWIGAWFVAWIGARVVLESQSVPTWARVVAALAPAPLGAAALLTIVRGARELDELEQRIQLEALAIAFVLAVLLLMTLGLMELAVTLNPDDWSYRHVWAMLPMLYFAGLVFARRRYA
ncbi:MAG TPA: hypothetical protein VNM36_07360 [Gemmatimonadaceae bacterium]|nr:hypothetical protein [Gemmatimonadaceae bacterium]